MWEKTTDLFDSTQKSTPPKIHFNAGLIPFSITFEGDAKLDANLICEIHGQVSAGVTWHHPIGDNYVTWDPSGKWQHTRTKHSQGSFVPTFDTELDDPYCDFSISLIPSITMTVDDIFHIKTEFDPKLHLRAEAEKNLTQVCGSGDFEADLSCNAWLGLDPDIAEWIKNFEPSFTITSKITNETFQPVCLNVTQPMIFM